MRQFEGSFGVKRTATTVVWLLWWVVWALSGGSFRDLVGVVSGLV